MILKVCNTLGCDHFVIKNINFSNLNFYTGIGALTFRTITMCPIQTKLIDRKLMTAVEVKLLSKSSVKFLLNVFYRLERASEFIS